MYISMLSRSGNLAAWDNSTRAIIQSEAGPLHASIFIELAPEILAKMVRNKLDWGAEPTSPYACPFKNILKKMKKRLVRSLNAGKSHRQT